MNDWNGNVFAWKLLDRKGLDFKEMVREGFNFE